MIKFKVERNASKLNGLLLLKPYINTDSRGYLVEMFNKRELDRVGFNISFVQENLVQSKKGVLRGLHFQNKYPQGKLIYVIKGRIFDVVVDIRSDSKTFGEWYSIILTSDNKIMMYVPEGFAHGYLVLEEETIVSYKCTDFYYPKDEMGIVWNDPNIDINWPCIRNDNSSPMLLDGYTEISISEKDKQWGTLNSLFK